MIGRIFLFMSVGALGWLVLQELANSPAPGDGGAGVPPESPPSDPGGTDARLRCRIECSSERLLCLGGCLAPSCLDGCRDQYLFCLESCDPVTAPGGGGPGGTVPGPDDPQETPPHYR